MSFSTVYSGTWKTAKVAVKELILDEGSADGVKKSMMKEIEVLR